ncbi:uncharacterized protein [Misgurnus anguillicaudatus]|uniref:uncharacterized protein isoform X2 n=1 Tax=Misgurnus anguillicaudatus TaxID=75329 RepID=UPI003CCFDE3E
MYSCVFKMHVLYCIFISALLNIADGFTVKGSSGPLVVPLGGSVVLPCSVDSLLSLEDLEVEWRRSDSQTLIHLYQDEDIRPESQHQDYHDRAHFFTEDIKHGNFSLLLNNLTAEDEGQYTCKVYIGQESGETVVEIKHERLIVSGSNKSISVYAGEDVTLSCSVDSHIKPEEIEEVSWKKRDKDDEIPVLLYQSNETLPESSDERYRDRVEFFTDEIHRGNFSLRLKRLTTEDKGVYICQVFAGEFSANTTVKLESLGFSGLHVLVLILCSLACGSAPLLSSLIYCRSNNIGCIIPAETSCHVLYLHVSLVFCPNICVFFAFIIWGVIEGFLNETITCCALYILRIFMLFWAVKYLKYLQDNHTTWIRFSSIPRELSVFTIIVYSVFFAYGWKERAHDTSIVPLVVLGVMFVTLVLCCLMIIIDFQRFRKIIAQFVRALSFFQSLQLMISFGLLNEAMISVLGVQVLLMYCVPAFSFLQKKCKVLQRRWIQLAILLLDIPLAIIFHLVTVDRQKDFWGWVCVILFIQVLRMIIFFEESLHVDGFSGVQRQLRTETMEADANLQGSSPWPLCNVIMYMFGAVGVVLLNSAALIAELILKARNGERVINDLRFIVFPSECVFALYWVVVLMHAFWKLVKSESVHNPNNLPQRNRHDQRDLQEPHEMETLSAHDTGVSQTHQLGTNSFIL